MGLVQIGTVPRPARRCQPLSGTQPEYQATPGTEQLRQPKLDSDITQFPQLDLPRCCVSSGQVIGGTSLFGGRGNIIPSSAAGVLLLMIISNGLSAWGVSPYIYPFAAGVVIFVAIYLDSLVLSALAPAF